MVQNIAVNCNILSKYLRSTAKTQATLLKRSKTPKLISEFVAQTTKLKLILRHDVNIDF